jgi:uncharacterized protein YjbJ (UPF0337 family)
MNTDTLQGKWRQLRGEAQIQWGRLTNDDLDEIAGNTEKLIGKLQERYGYARDRAARELEQFEGRWVKNNEKVSAGGRG